MESNSPRQDQPHKETTPIPVTPTPASLTPVSMSSKEANQSTNERGSEPATPVTPGPAGGGMFDRIKKVWQGAEPKVSQQKVYCYTVSVCY